jgi:hypothetical protein
LFFSRLSAYDQYDVLEGGLIMKLPELIIENNWTEQPSGNRIFGNFIESGFGRQVNGMWAEMLYNRAFREVPEYREPTWQWLGLDREHYKTADPRWHSGYEEYDWEPLGTPEINHSLGCFTFKGMSSLLVKNKQAGRLCGLRQKGIHLQQGGKYQFRLFAGVYGDMSSAGLNGFGDIVHDNQSQTLHVTLGKNHTAFALTTVSKLCEWEFEAVQTEITDIRITFEFEGALILAFSSLMPRDNLGGWRKDVVEKLREVSPSVVRFPGGCFVSFYNWESSVGNRDTREPQPSFYWGGLEENDVGLDEFLHLSRLAGFEPQICFNMMTSTPFKARQMVEYLNGPPDAGMGRMRMLNGYPSPYGVKLFEMDNEPARKWTAEQYARQCVDFAREMRLGDPSIQFMFAAYTYLPEALPYMLEIAGKDIDYVIYRDGAPDFVARILPVLREYNRQNGANLKLANTEWLPSCYSPEPFEDPGVPANFSWEGKITNNYATVFSTQQRSWNYALNGAHRLLDYISYGGEFFHANFNNMCNTWGQNVIEASKDSCYLSCMGKVFAWFAKIFRPCHAAGVRTGDDMLFALAAKTLDGEEQLYIVNHAGSDRRVVLPEGGWICKDGLLGDSRLGYISEGADCVHFYIAAVEGREAVFKPLSIACLIRK